MQYTTRNGAVINLVPTNQPIISENYPYGYTLKTTKTDWIEFKPKQGFRHMSQTVNPKNGRLNNPKKGTYSSVMLLGTDNESGHTVCIGFTIESEGVKEINKWAKFMHDYSSLFQANELTKIAESFYVSLIVTIKATVVYCGANFEDLKPLFESSIKAAKEGRFDLIQLDEEAIEATEDKDYKPFKTVSYGTI